MIRKFFAEPAVAILTLTVMLALFFLGLIYRQKLELVAQVKRLEKQIEELANLKVGDIVPPLGLTDPQSKPSQAIYRAGEKQLLLIFSSGCSACKLQETAIWNQLAAQAKGKGFQPRGIFMGKAETLAAFLKDHPYQFEVLVADPILIRRAYRINAIPQLVLLDGTGKVELIHQGIIDEAELNYFLAQMDSIK